MYCTIDGLQKAGFCLIPSEKPYIKLIHPFHSASSIFNRTTLFSGRAPCEISENRFLIFTKSFNPNTLSFLSSFSIHQGRYKIFPVLT